MKIGTIIQARMSSERLPGKILMDLGGKEALWHTVERCKRSSLSPLVIVATSDDSSDNKVEEFCKAQGVEFFRGVLKNVLMRYYECAKIHNLDAVVRITGDCPLADPTVIDAVVSKFLESECDYATNCFNRNFPRGLDCEIFSFQALELAHQNAQSDFEKEHVTPYIIKHGKVAGYNMPTEFHGNYRLTLDTREDYELLTKVFNEFYHPGSQISVPAVIKYLSEHAEVAALNSMVRQKESIDPK